MEQQKFGQFCVLGRAFNLHNLRPRSANPVLDRPWGMTAVAGFSILSFAVLFVI